MVHRSLTLNCENMKRPVIVGIVVMIWTAVLVGCSPALKGREEIEVPPPEPPEVRTPSLPGPVEVEIPPPIVEPAPVLSAPYLDLYRSWIDNAMVLSIEGGFYALIVDKEARRLYTYLNGDCEANYGIGIGYTDALDLTDKRVSGDGHAKEGLFLLSRIAIDQTGKFDGVWMEINTAAAARQDYLAYCGEEGAENVKAFEAQHGEIQDGEDIRRFNAAYSPSMYRGLGIHGGGAGSDWTLGCVALDREDAWELYHRILGTSNGGVGTPVAVVRYGADRCIRIGRD